MNTEPDLSDTQSPFPETADIESASEDYAKRFSGAAGAWLLDIQSDRLRRCLKGLSNGTALDVGGGHGQTAPVLQQAGFEVTVTGSAACCAERVPDGIPTQVANHLELPYEDQSFDLVISFRLMTHCTRWPELIRELCRVAHHRVIIDYPSRVSVNFLADALFGLKKGFEKNTRTFRLFSHREIRDAFAREGFTVVRRPQFFWPMVLHRMLKNPSLSRVLESIPRFLGLTHLFGSPVVLEAIRKPDVPKTP